MLHLLTTSDTTDTTESSEVMAAPTASDQVRTLLLHAGPYTSVYLATRPMMRHAGDDLARRWAALKIDLESVGSPPAALAAIEARLLQPMPEDTAAIAVIAAADGASIIDHALEPPRRDFGTVETLPYLAPLFEWEQRRIPHVTVSAVPGGADVVTFTGDLAADLTTISGPSDVIAAEVSRQAAGVGARVIVVGGHDGADDLTKAIRLAAEPTIRVEHEAGTVDEFAEATVRHVADAGARDTVGWLRELRFERAHDDLIDGTADVVDAIGNGEVGTLLIHDDPDDHRRVWIGPAATSLSIEPDPLLTRDARLVDAAICATVINGGTVHIVPSTGPNGPEDDAALVRRRHPSTQSNAADVA